MGRGEIGGRGGNERRRGERGRRGRVEEWWAVGYSAGGLYVNEKLLQRHTLTHTHMASEAGLGHVVRTVYSVHAVH